MTADQPLTGLTDLQCVGLVVFLVTVGFVLCYLIIGSDERDYSVENADEPRPMVFGPTTVVVPQPVERIPDELLLPEYEPSEPELFSVGVETDVRQALAIGDDR